MKTTLGLAIVATLTVGIVVYASRPWMGSPARWHEPGGGSGHTLQIGIIDSPFLGALYAARQAPDAVAPFDLLRFDAPAEMGYALLAGRLDAAFLDPGNASRLLAAPGSNHLRVAGAIQFPYGATLVLRKDLKLRLADLAGRKVAVTGPHCALLHQFQRDATRLGANPGRIHFEFMPAEALLPALESRSVDAAIMKGARAILAEAQGHKVLYQKWDLTADDDCCPAILAQVELLLVVALTGNEAQIAELVRAVEAANAKSPDELRQAILSQIAFPEPALRQFPLASFAALNAAQREKLGDRSWSAPR